MRHPIPAVPIPILGAVALLSLAGGIAGCGSKRAGSAPTKAQFAARADAICKDEAVKLSRVAAFQHEPRAAFGEVPRLIRKAVALREVTNAKLESLRAPAGDGAAIGEWLTARTIVTTLQHDLGEAPSGEDAAAVKDLREQLKRASAVERGVSLRDGFADCAGTG